MRRVLWIWRSSRAARSRWISDHLIRGRDRARRMTCVALGAKAGIRVFSARKSRGAGAGSRPLRVVVHLGAGMPAGMAEASVSPWGGDQAASLKHFMPATYILGMIGAPSLSQIASPGADDGRAASRLLTGCGLCSDVLKGLTTKISALPQRSAIICAATCQGPAYKPAPCLLAQEGIVGDADADHWRTGDRGAERTRRINRRWQEVWVQCPGRGPAAPGDRDQSAVSATVVALRLSRASLYCP